ncbi:hypothetical protein EBZ39_12665, partial [bacterium]|nr:hypothetical protein [bacterium]
MSYRSFLLTVLVVATGLVILALFFHSRHEPDAQPDVHLPLAQVQGITIVKRDKNGNLCTIIAEAVQLPQHQQDIACKRVTVTLAGEKNDQQAVLQIAEANIDRDGKVVKCHRRV